MAKNCLVLTESTIQQDLAILEKYRKYADIAELCLTIQDFIKDAEIKNIGVPIFIAHGTETSVDDIFKKLEKIPKKNLFDINTIYYLISLPILNKNKLVATFTRMIRERMDYYESVAK